VETIPLLGAVHFEGGIEILDTSSSPDEVSAAIVEYRVNGDAGNPSELAYSPG
jgi:hypothetical protein